jgi:SAM-dependent methyltransferase
MRAGRVAVSGSATELPFRDRSFGAVWSFGLLHHLEREHAIRAIEEMVRVVAPGGKVVVFDAVMPRRWWCRPLVWPLRRYDRGGHVRRQEGHEELLLDRHAWHCERFTYSWIGHEGMFSVYQRSTAG